MSETKMPETIVAWPNSDAAITGTWGAERHYSEDARPYTRTDLVETERAECIEVLRDIVSFLDDQYRDERAIALEGEYIAKAARPTWTAATALLSKLEAKS